MTTVSSAVGSGTLMAMLPVCMSIRGQLMSNRGLTKTDRLRVTTSSAKIVGPKRCSFTKRSVHDSLPNALLPFEGVGHCDFLAGAQLTKTIGFVNEFLYDQIDLAAISEPNLSGDFNDNGVLDVADVNLLNSEIAAGTHNADLNLNSDAVVDTDDLRIWVKDIKSIYFGDGEFSSADLIAVFQGGKYDVDMVAGWNEGDWTGDRRFNSTDLIAAFQDGGYEQGPRPVAAVPEPGSTLILLAGLTGIGVVSRTRRRILQQRI